MMCTIMERVTEFHVRNCDSMVARFYKHKVKEMGVKKALVSASHKMMSVIHSILKNKRYFRLDPSA